MTSRRTRYIAVGAFSSFLAVAGTYELAHANRFTADADCAGFTFDMLSTEDGTTIRLERNGQAVPLPWRDGIVDAIRIVEFGTPVSLRLPSPDQTVAQSWRVTVVGFNGTQSYAETVGACVTPSTSSSSTTTTPPTSIVPTTTVATTVPPPPPSSSTVVTTVVTTPRPTTTTVAPTWTLPETGQDMTVPLVVAALCGAAGAAFLTLVRRRA